nr:orotidine-5'-phosphate decarboxylase [Oceanibacterium hippocampi]
MTNNPVFCAIDRDDIASARALAASLRAEVGGLKFGKEFFAANGPAGVEEAGQGLPLFLDLKLHDIPNTVAGAVRAAAARLRPTLITVHASGGPAMLRAAVEAAAAFGPSRPRIIAVTVLTSLDDADLKAVGFAFDSGDLAERLARLALDCGVDGAVCSPHEIGRLRGACGPDFKLVVPGIRPSNSIADDQKRVMTPEAALAGGADYLVIGRPITAAEDPPAAARAICQALRPAA